MMCPANVPSFWLLLIIVTMSLNLQGCIATGSGEKSGLMLLVIGILIAFAGFKLATRTALEQWAMKLLTAGAIIFLLG